MMRIRLLLVAALASSTILVGAAPAQARCLPEFWLVCHVYVVVCNAVGKPCAA